MQYYTKHVNRTKFQASKAVPMHPLVPLFTSNISVENADGYINKNS